MALTLLPKWKSTDIGTDLFPMVTGYRIYRTCARLDHGFSPSSTTFFLATITSIEVAKTITSFLTFFSSSEDIGYHNNLSFHSESTWLGRCLFFPSWEWHWHPSQMSLSLVSVFVYAEDFCSSFGFFLNRQKKSGK